MLTVKHVTEGAESIYPAESTTFFPNGFEIGSKQPTFGYRNRDLGEYLYGGKIYVMNASGATVGKYVLDSCVCFIEHMEGPPKGKGVQIRDGDGGSPPAVMRHHDFRATPDGVTLHGPVSIIPKKDESALKCQNCIDSWDIHGIELCEKHRQDLDALRKTKKRKCGEPD